MLSGPQKPANGCGKVEETMRMVDQRLQKEEAMAIAPTAGLQGPNQCQ